MTIKGKNILIGISSSIAAYKMVDMVKLFKEEGANVKVILTENAKHFVSKITLETFLQGNVYESLWQDPLSHINLARWADVFLIAPATANTLCKLSVGITDNLLTNVFLACNKPKLLAPAMNTVMLESNQVQRALKLLTKDGCTIIAPYEAKLACNEHGNGHIASYEEIMASVKKELFNKTLHGKNIVITGGGTFETIDPIRTINNKSTGYFAIELAKECYFLGANVVLIMANASYKSPKYINCIKVTSADNMLNESLKQIENNNVDYFICSAAISDYFVKNKSNIKLKKQDSYNIELGLNKDVVKTVANSKKRPKVVVGFCAETLTEKNLIISAKNKLINKNLDYIVANDVSYNKGFGNVKSSIYILGKNSKQISFVNLTKNQLSKKIIATIFS